jgi:hypothetical protein
MLRWLQSRWLGFVRELDELRGAPFVAVLLALAALLLLATPQGADVAVTAADGWQSVFLVAASFLYGVQCWLWTRFIVEQHTARIHAKAAAQALGQTPAAALPSPHLTRAHEWAPRVLGAAPFLIAAGAVFHTRNWLLAGILALLGLVMLLGLWARRGVVRRLGLPAGPGVSRGFRLASLVSAGIAMAVFCLWPVGPAQALGAVGVAFVGLAFITAVLASVLHANRQSRLPVLAALLVWAALLSFFVDNHAIGRRAPAFGAGKAMALATPRQPSLDDAFDRWNTAQAKCGAGQPTPIVFVAAAGGASRAGYWAAEVLGRLQGIQAPCRFDQRLFAISSVSGGSVGAVSYLSTLATDPTLSGEPFRTAVTAAAGGDFLSPAVGGLLFPDLFQRFFPVTIFPDRSETLERGFEAGWRDHCAGLPGACQPDLWKRRMLDLWPKDGRWLPVLLINGTRQEDGKRLITSNVDADPNVFPDALDYHDLTGRDVSLSAAISNGARFPLVSPGGTLVDAGGGQHGHLLDGGYFDGGGVVTMADAAAAIDRIAKARGASLRPIFIEINNDDMDDPHSNPSDLERIAFGDRTALNKAETHNFLADILGPLEGLSQTRGSHGTAAAIALALQTHRQPDAPPAIIPAPPTAGAPASSAPPLYLVFHLCKLDKAGMPMDWAISKTAKLNAAASLDRANTSNVCVRANIVMLDALTIALGGSRGP